MNPQLKTICKHIGRLHGNILLRGRKDVADAVEIGRLLNDAKPLCGREFVKWIEQNCGFTYQSAYMYRRLASHAAKSKNILDFKTLTEAYAAAGVVRLSPSLVPPKHRNLTTQATPVPDIVDGFPVDRILCGDAKTILRQLPERCIQCCVTSPPYYMQRDYGIEGQIGWEPTVDQYIQKLVGVFTEVQRVLRDDGTLWIIIGDSYAGSGPSRNFYNSRKGRSLGRTAIPEGLKRKDLLGIPWRLAFALQAAGWFLRCDVVWHKPNAMPETVSDRPARSHEYMFLLSKNEDYFFDANAIMESGGHPNAKRSVWYVSHSHVGSRSSAAFPEQLVEPCVLAGAPAGSILLDCFGGSGTVAAVSQRLGRSFISIDINPQYVEMARLRVAQQANKPMHVSVG